jgi:acetyl-CoA synthetase
MQLFFLLFLPALKYRLENLKTKVLITADGYYRKGKLINLKAEADEAILGTSVEKLIIAKRANNPVTTNPNVDFWYDEITKNESADLKAEVMDSEDLLFVLPESGTSGQFLPVMHSHGGYTVYATFTGKAVFDFKPTDTLWCTSDPGWITGHTYTIYSPLLNGATTVIYEGAIDYPHPCRWADIIGKYKATIFYTAPTAIRMLEKQSKEILLTHQFNNLRLLGSVGEAIDEPTWMWYFQNIGKENCPIVDTWWQTETGGIILSSLPGIGPFKPSFTGLPLPGINLEILDENKKPCKQGVEGSLVILPPFPPAILRGIYNNEKSYIESYWSQYGTDIYFTSDSAFKDEHGLIKIVGRTDDTLKIAGHRISTGEIENAAGKTQNILESAVIGVPDELKGETAVIFVICKNNQNLEQTTQDVILEIKKEIGPIAQPKEIFIVEEFPKTKSGKTMRGILKKIYLSQDLGDLAVVSNPESIEKIRSIIHK